MGKSPTFLLSIGPILRIKLFSTNWCLKKRKKQKKFSAKEVTEWSKWLVRAKQRINAIISSTNFINLNNRTEQYFSSLAGNQPPLISLSSEKNANKIKQGHLNKPCCCENIRWKNCCSNIENNVLPSCWNVFVGTYQGFPLVCFCSRSFFSSLENCRSSSKELLSRPWMYCSMLLLDLSGREVTGIERAWEELDWITSMFLNWLRRSSYWSMRNFIQLMS